MPTSIATEPMDSVATAPELLPRLHSWIQLSDLGGDEYVVKNSRSRSYFHAGPEEYYLLGCLSRSCTLAEMQQGFGEQFSEQLELEDVDDFLRSIRRRDLIPALPNDSPDIAARLAQPKDDNFTEEDEDETDDELSHGGAGWRGQGSIFFYRLPLLDPDRLLSWVVRCIPWVWTPGFLIASLVGMLSALSVLLTSHSELLASFNSSLRWDTLVLVGLTTLLVTALHEVGHGATCKRFGGEVHEAGVLFLLLMPCLYVNVSDAWLLPDRRKRLLITAAGGYTDLCLWCGAVFVWRLTLPGTLPNHLSFVVLMTCGARGLINFNPLMRLDGYYLLSDLLRIPNLYSKARKHWMQCLAWGLWGAPRPPKIPRSRVLFWYGMLSWTFAIGFLNVVLINIVSYASQRFGYVGWLFGFFLLIYAVRRVFRGFLGVEFMEMLKSRLIRTLTWVTGLGMVATACALLPMRHYTFGDFEVRPGERVDVPVPLNSFISHVYVEDGQRVQAGDVLVELQSLDLLSQIITKEAELKESEANLARLKAGTRAEELADQESRVQRLNAWFELGKLELDTTRRSLELQLTALQHRIAQVTTDVRYAETALEQSRRLNDQGALANVQLEKEVARLAISRERVLEIEAERAALETNGIRIATAELSRREQELADAEGKLRLLKLGSRPEDIAAEDARRERLVQELKFFNEQRQRLVVVAPTDGYVSAPRLRENVGRFNTQGTLLCQVERPDVPRVEIFVPEDDAMSVADGQTVFFKARALPFETFEGLVERIAPAAAKPQEAIAAQQPAVRQTVVVHCRVPGAEGKLKSGMTGLGRVSRGWSTLGKVLLIKAHRYVRTEFWW